MAAVSYFLVGLGFYAFLATMLTVLVYLWATRDDEDEPEQQFDTWEEHYGLRTGDAMYVDLEASYNAPATYLYDREREGW